MMFGWGTQRVDAPQLNARNPLCAEVFHPIFDRTFESERGLNNQIIFKLCKDDIEKRYAASKRARKQGNHEQFRNRVLSVVVELLSTTANDASIIASQDAVKFGRSNVLGTIGDIIFGFAPGLALEGPSEAHKIAQSMIQDLQVAIKWTAPNTYLYGAWQACSEFLAALRQLEQGRQPGATARRGEDVGATVTGSAPIQRQPPSQRNQPPYGEGPKRQRGEDVTATASVKRTTAGLGDEREAARLFRLATDQGHAAAQTNLGHFCLESLGGLSKDEDEAVRLYRLACDQGDAKVQFTLALWYAQGRGGLPQNEREAARLFKLAADQGHAEAQFKLARIHERSLLPFDGREAARLYKLAADQGYIPAQIALANLFKAGKG
jgi:TPR repeat protein